MVFLPQQQVTSITANSIFKYFDRGCANSGIFAVLCRLGKMAEVERKVAFDLDVAAF
jgi:hypothetical protein